MWLKGYDFAPFFFSFALFCTRINIESMRHNTRKDQQLKAKIAATGLEHEMFTLCFFFFFLYRNRIMYGKAVNYFTSKSMQKWPENNLPFLFIHSLNGFFFIISNIYFQYGYNLGLLRRYILQVKMKVVQKNMFLILLRSNSAIAKWPILYAYLKIRIIMVITSQKCS